MVGIVMQTLIHGVTAPEINIAGNLVDEALSIAMHAMRARLHSTLDSTAQEA